MEKTSHLHNPPKQQSRNTNTTATDGEQHDRLDLYQMRDRCPTPRP